MLFVDIRNSVQLTKDKQDRTMGRLYSVFAHCVLLAAQEEGGFVRNIIGDRVMIVFPPDKCYTKAVHCAITINHIAMLPSRSVGLPPLSPSRTVHATFTAHGSCNSLIISRFK